MLYLSIITRTIGGRFVYDTFLTQLAINLIVNVDRLDDRRLRPKVFCVHKAFSYLHMPRSSYDIPGRRLY